MSQRIRRDAGAVGLAFALCGALAGGSRANDCERVILFEYKIRDAGYQFELNDVFLDGGGSQLASGGIPLDDWLLRRENALAASIDGDSGDVSVSTVCEDGSQRVELAAARLSGRETRTLAFNVDDPPDRLFLDTSPTDDAGLLDAVARLKAAMADRDFDTVWLLHAAMRIEKERLGQPMKALAYQFARIVENAEPDFAANLRTHAVLGGRVWEVYGDDIAPPVSDVVEMNGGRVPFRTGSFWMKIDGSWSVYRQ